MRKTRAQIQSIRDVFAKAAGRANGDVRHKLRNFNFGMSSSDCAIPSVKALAESLGISISEENLPRNVRGYLAPDTWAESGYRIVTNSKDDITTKRFTVLHEIGHWLLHPRGDFLAADVNRASLDADVTHLYDETEVRQEREANEFAEALIFGDGALEAALTLYGEDKAKLCRHFGVGEKTLEIALRKMRKI